MRKDPIKEEEFYNKDYNFSYSSLNKLLFSPKLFYIDYILKERELKTDKHLIEGKLLHLLLLQPEKLHEEFSIVPNKIPSDNVRRVLYQVKETAHLNVVPNLEDHEPEIITALKHQNLYQSFKDDSKRLAKILTDDNKEYFKFLLESKGKNIIDNDMLAKATERVEILKANKNVMSLMEHTVTDFEMDPVEVHNEKYLKCELLNYKFGLQGYIDRYIIDHDSKEITIVDLKTTAKGLEKFAETVDYYKYWMQAVIYSVLVIKNSEDKTQDYKINFKFAVIDNYDQVYVFDVSDETMQQWNHAFVEILNIADYHYKERNYSLPYEFARDNVKL